MLSDQIVYQTDDHGNKIHKYIKKEQIGSGGFAKCYLFVNAETGEKLAAKVIDAKQVSDRAGRAKISQETQIHKEMSHPNVVKFYDIFEFEGEIYMVMQLCQNNSLKQFVKTRKRITEFQAKCYLHQIIEGLQYIHSKNIIHRDIKLGNLFLSYKMEVKIGDFGLSTRLKTGRERRFTTCGTPNYIAPEILRETGHSYEADIWAIGIILYAMLIGKPPFQSNSVENTYTRIKNNQYEFPKQIPLSPQAKHLIKSILDPNPKSRLTLQKIKTHQFLNKEEQSIPRTMPIYTISMPPQNNFVNQYKSDKSDRTMKLLVYPRKITEKKPPTIEYLGTNQSLPRIQKMSRVLSADKNFVKKFDELSKGYKEASTLNRGRYIKHLRTSSLSKQSRNSGKIKPLPKTERAIPKSPRKYEQDATQIICYYDMSQKYGIGYLLSNGNYGVVFNDNTSLTKMCIDLDRKESEKQKSAFMYYNKQENYLTEIPATLQKKFQILKICEDKLKNYRKNHILIPYKSHVHAKKWQRANQCFIIKMSNGILQFFWDSDSVTLRGYKWVKWRVSEEEGEGAITQKNFPKSIMPKIQEVKDFLVVSSQNSKKRKQ